MILVDLDFETRSLADLSAMGAERYAEYIGTEIICLLYRVDEGPWCIWTPGDATADLTGTADLMALAADPDVMFVAHNAGFEQAVWRSIMVALFGFPPIPIERWEDTMATAAWKSIPLALDMGAAVLALGVQKDAEGRALTLSMSKPLTKKAHAEMFPGEGTKKAWNETFRPGMLPKLTPTVRRRIAAYCQQDVAVAGTMRHRLGLLSDQSQHERGVWMLDQRINQRGVRIDMPFVRAAMRVVERATIMLRSEFAALTDGLGTGQVARIHQWCRERGVELENLQKGTIATLLGHDIDGDAEQASLAMEDEDAEMLGKLSLPAEIRRVLAIRQMLGSASIKKLDRMLVCVCDDGRARGLLQYHAAHPGRWGGRLLQPQNFPRGGLVYPDSKKGVSTEEVVGLIMAGDPAALDNRYGKMRPDGSVMLVQAIEVVAASLRHALIPDRGKVFGVGDYAGIEARIVLALAGQHDKTALMASGFDVYLDMAEDIYKRPKGSWAVTDKTELARIKTEFVGQRTIGKNTILGCGFQMGGDRFHERYCSEQPLEFAHEVVRAYRKQWAPRVPPLWYAIEAAAVDAVRYGRAEVYGCEFKKEDGWLSVRLPSGWQKVWYFDPVMFVDPRFNKDAWYYHAQKQGHWTRINAYGGLLTENVVQALARGLLVAAMFRLEAAGMPIVLTVHDEAVVEVDERTFDLAAFRQCMAEPTWWAEAIKIPISVEEFADYRYRK